MQADGHHSQIIDQFTRQAVPFNSAATITSDQGISLLLHAADPQSHDIVLDLACGGGVVLCAFASRIRHGIGLDLTPAMLEHARKLAAERQLGNLAWVRGDVTTLPFEDHAFSKVLTRFSLHHVLDPFTVLLEMKRVCAPGGRIIVADMYASELDEQAAAWNRLEILRDPSHRRCLPLSELRQLFARAELAAPVISTYELHDTVDNLLSRSFPKPGDAEKIRALFAQAVAEDGLGIRVTHRDGELSYHYPVAVLSADRFG